MTKLRPIAMQCVAQASCLWGRRASRLPFVRSPGRQDARRSHRQDACATRRWAALLGAFALLAGAASGFQQERAIDVANDSGIEMHMGFPFGEQPMTGFYPVHLSIVNGSSSGHSWDLDVRNTDSSPSIRFKTSVAVGAYQRREIDVLIPCASLDNVRPAYQSVIATITGYGVVNGNFGLPSHYTGGNGAARIAVVDTLGTAMWSALETKVRAGEPSPQPVSLTTAELTAARFSGTNRNSGRMLRGSLLRLEELPADARALSGFAGLWLSEADWRGMTGPRRAAVRQWIMEGGRLFLVGVTTPPLPGLPPLPADLVPFGFGEIRKLPSAATLPVNDTAAQILGLDGAPAPPWEQDFAGWALRNSVGEPHLNVPLLIVFVCVFGVLVGPVNLLLFAPPAKRYRLFFTVPLLSAGASLLLLGLIAFGDGVGGDGARNVLMLVAAGENRLSLFQEQMVRTRLLFQRSFKLPETVAASFLSQEGRESSVATLIREGNTLSGDWFRTRAVQGMYLRTSIPSRGEVVLRPGPVPELLSTLSSKLRHVHYFEGPGKYWTVDELVTGRPARLHAETAQEFGRWTGPVSLRLSPALRAQFESVLWRPGWFYADAEPTAENTVPTLRSIRWTQQNVVCLGPCTPEAAP